MFALLTLLFIILGCLTASELLIIAASGFAIATSIDFLRDDIREIAEGKKTE